jgi:hypothetical protein
MILTVVRTFNVIGAGGVVPEIRFKPSTTLVKRKCMAESADNGVGGRKGERSRDQADGVDGIPKEKEGQGQEVKR